MSTTNADRRGSSISGILGNLADLMPEINGNKIYSGLSTQNSTPSTVSDSDIAVEDGTVRVKKKLGLMSGTALIVGTMIGE